MIEARLICISSAGAFTHHSFVGFQLLQWSFPDSGHKKAVAKQHLSRKFQPLPHSPSFSSRGVHTGIAARLRTVHALHCTGCLRISFTLKFSTLTDACGKTAHTNWAKQHKFLQNIEASSYCSMKPSFGGGKVMCMDLNTYNQSLKLQRRLKCSFFRRSKCS